MLQKYKANRTDKPNRSEIILCNDFANMLWKDLLGRILEHVPKITLMEILLPAVFHLAYTLFKHFSKGSSTLSPTYAVACA